MAIDKGNDHRGIYRSIYCQLWEDPAFKEFSPDEKLVFLNLRTSPLANIIALYPVYLEVIQCQTGIPRERVEKALKNLSAARWIQTQWSLVWVRRGLRFDPNISLRNEKHLLAVKRAILSLPKCQLVRDFIDEYGIPIAYPIPSRKASRNP